MRSVPANIINALTNDSAIIKRVMVRFDVPSGSVGMWDGDHDIIHDGVTYLGASGRFQLAPLPAVSDLSIPSVQIVFSTADSNIFQTLNNEQWHQQPCFIYLALAAVGDPATYTIVPWFSGFLDTAEFDDKIGADNKITVKVETIARNLNISGSRRRNDNDQQSLYAGDRFFEHVSVSVEVPINWGSKDAQNPA